MWARRGLGGMMRGVWVGWGVFRGFGEDRVFGGDRGGIGGMGDVWGGWGVFVGGIGGGLLQPQPVSPSLHYTINIFKTTAQQRAYLIKVAQHLI